MTWTALAFHVIKWKHCKSKTRNSAVMQFRRPSHATALGALHDYMSFSYMLVMGTQFSGAQ